MGTGRAEWGDARKGRKRGRVRRLRLVWQDETWQVDLDDVLEDIALPPGEPSPVEQTPDFYWDVVDERGEVAYTRADHDPRVGFYDHLTDQGELEGGRVDHDYAVIDVLLPDAPGAEFFLYARTPGADATGPEREAPQVALTHRIGGRHG